MSDITHISTAAWRYARALAELADEEGQTEAVSVDLEVLAKALEAAPELARFISSPLHGPRQQRAVLEALAEKMKLAELTRRFLSVLVENRRLALLEEVIVAWRQLQAERRGETKVRAITAEPLNATQRKKLQSVLKKALGKQVDIDNSVNPDILGGLVLHVGSRMIDASVRQRLNALKGMLKGV